MKSGAFAENGKKEKYTEPLSSGRVYAVHLFVLVSSVKIFAHYTENRASKSISMPKKPTTPSHHPKKILPEETFTLSAVHTAKVSTKQDVCELYFFPVFRMRYAVFPVPIAVVVARSTFLHELICWNRFHFPSHFTFFLSLFSAVLHIPKQKENRI